jgi:hypothetical protein
MFFDGTHGNAEPLSDLGIGFAIDTSANEDLAGSGGKLRERVIQRGNGLARLQCCVFRWLPGTELFRQYIGEHMMPPRCRQVMIDRGVPRSSIENALVVFVRAIGAGGKYASEDVLDDLRSHFTITDPATHERFEMSAM